MVGEGHEGPALSATPAATHRRTVGRSGVVWVDGEIRVRVRTFGQGQRGYLGFRVSVSSRLLPPFGVLLLIVLDLIAY